MFFSDVEGSHIAVHLQLFISVSLMFLQSVMRAIVVAIPQASLQSADLIGLHRALCDGLSHHCTSSVTLLTEPFLLALFSLTLLFLPCSKHTFLSNHLNFASL